MNYDKKNNSRIILGCMRLTGCSNPDYFIDYALDKGVNYFDHADIYGNGQCEEIFGRWLLNNKNKREDIILQSKCSIVPGVMYDCSKEYILNSVDNILKRLNTEYLDSLLIHRPDALMDVEEVADTFDILKKSGKVKNFGVSNFNSMQIELLQKYLNQKISINQLQLSVVHSSMITSGMEVNMNTMGAVNRDSDTLNYCRLKDINIQAWSPLQYGMIEGSFIDNDKYKKLNDKLLEIGNKYNLSKAAAAVAWILRHPANINVISGTFNKEHFDEIIKACDVNLTRKEWYDIYLSAGNILP